MKKILFSDESPKIMTFEEVRKRFLPLAIKMAKREINKFVFDAPESGDFMQEMEIEIWRAYKDYNPDYGNCFSTYLYPKLRKGIRNATHSRYSLKNQGSTASMNAPMGDDDLKLEDLFSSNDSSMDNMQVNELTAIIRSNVSEEEEEELLLIILDVSNHPVQEYADKHGITRQAANQRVIKFKKKIQTSVSKLYLEIC